MQLVLTLDWVSIGASIVAMLALGASVFSAIGAAKSADVARSAEQRIVASERNVAVRELMRTVAKVELETRLVTHALEDASRSAIATAACYSTVDRKIPFLRENGVFQQKIGQMKEQADHGVTVEMAMAQSGEWIEKMQLDLDKTLIELSGEKAWAFKRAEQLVYVNRQLAEDVTASERSKGIYIQQDHNGLVV